MLETLLANPWLTGICLFVFGTIVGSFLNVCIHRIPLEQSLILPASRCECGENIPWRFNLPVLSWLMLRGRAACCGRSISVRYLLVEILTGMIFAYASFHFSNHEFYLLFLGSNLFFACILICVTFIDLEHMIIPNRFSFGGAVCGVLIACAFPELWGVTDDGLIGNVRSGSQALFGLLVGSGILYWIGVMGESLLRKEAIGQGDVKLLGCVGAFCGWKGALFCIFGGAVLGTVLLLPVALGSFLKSTDSSDEEKHTSKLGWGVEVPFGPFLVSAALLYQLGLDTFADDFFQQISYIFRTVWNEGAPIVSF